MLAPLTALHTPEVAVLSLDISLAAIFTGFLAIADDAKSARETRPTSPILTAVL
ncbi:MAG: hypothetical protein NTY17_03625 [Planctomycetia bacterium]|nr:hypothetical protein [Planctomycetia bacterium]